MGRFAVCVCNLTAGQQHIWGCCGHVTILTLTTILIIVCHVLRTSCKATDALFEGLAKRGVPFEEVAVAGPTTGVMGMQALVQALGTGELAHPQRGPRRNGTALNVKT